MLQYGEVVLILSGSAYANLIMTRPVRRVYAVMILPNHP